MEKYEIRPRPMYILTFFNYNKYNLYLQGWKTIEGRLPLYNQLTLPLDIMFFIFDLFLPFKRFSSPFMKKHEYNIIIKKIT